MIIEKQNKELIKHAIINDEIINNLLPRLT